MMIAYLTPLYVPQIVRVIHESVKEYIGKINPPLSAHSETKGNLYDTMQTAIAVIDDNGSLAGCVLLMIDQRGVRITRLSVLPEHRGRNLAGSLLRSAEAFSLRAKQKRIFSFINKKLPHLKEVYGRCGYTLAIEQNRENYWLVEKFLE